MKRPDEDTPAQESEALTRRKVQGKRDLEKKLAIAIDIFRVW